MNLREEETLVICVSPGIDKKWDVSEKGADAPLASFAQKEDAYAYAKDLTRSRKHATVLVEEREGFFPLPLHSEHDNLNV